MGRPGPEALALVPHRLYGVLPAAEPCSAALWRRMALDEIRASHDEGRLPILAESGLAERLRRAAEEALGRKPPPEGSEAAAWLQRLLSREPEAWPLAALPRDAAEVEEDEEAPPEGEPTS